MSEDPAHPDRLRFAISADGLICEVRTEWDKFVEDCDRIPFWAARILGTPLLQHVEGEETRDFILELLAHARFGLRERTLEYRCDAPGLKRYMEMDLAPEDGSVLLTHRLIRTEALQLQFRFHTGPTRDTVRCSMCNRVRFHDEWQEAEAAHAAGHLLPDSSTLVTYKVCVDCRSAAMVG